MHSCPQDARIGPGCPVSTGAGASSRQMSAVLTRVASALPGTWRPPGWPPTWHPCCLFLPVLAGSPVNICSRTWRRPWWWEGRRTAWWGLPATGAFPGNPRSVATRVWGASEPPADGGDILEHPGGFPVLSLSPKQTYVGVSEGRAWEFSLILFEPRTFVRILVGFICTQCYS